MTHNTPENGIKSYARIAGFMYIAIIAIYITGEVIGAQFSGSSFSETSSNIAAAETVYRASLLLELLSSLLCVILAGALYVVLKPFSPRLALFALVWRACEVAVGSAGILFQFARVRLFTVDARALDPEQVADISRIMGALYSNYFNGGVLFFTFGSTLFFYLFLRSRLIPRSLAVLGLTASVWTMGTVMAEFLVPGALPMWKWAPIFVAEISVGLWLLVMAVDQRWLNARRTPAESRPDS